MMAYEELPHRLNLQSKNLVKFDVSEKETNLSILAGSDLSSQALAALLKYRADIERYIQTDPQFAKSYSPLRLQRGAAPIIKEMAAAAKRTNVGPMAAVAGALAEFVGKELLSLTDEIIVENGQDVLLKINHPLKIRVSEKVALEIDPNPSPFSICTSSGTAGHSISFGKADAVVTIANNASLADASATAIGNVIMEAADIEKGLNLAKRIRGLSGTLIIKNDQVGAVGKVKIVPI